ncbi:unnamed protein product [Ambrosiozyma monospora]|uniref:Unnamed protein product n=1 Tax=Ambrosiozyma monospora TaxID=43982 RepID=A0ACB5UBZ4_AMBMO|nr:unnamed protein product [Ambrosiozyma monospora]
MASDHEINSRSPTKDLRSDDEDDQDLFGDDSEEEQQQHEENREPRKKFDIDANDEDDDEATSAHNEFGERSEEEDEEDVQRAELTLPRHPKSHNITRDLYSFNLPRFLFVDPEPFAPTNFEAQLKEFLQENKGRTNKELQDSIEFKKLELLNTIRWRYAKTETDELYKQ